MRADIHPKYVDAEIRCACGNVIKTRFGFHVIKVEEIKEASKRELKDVEQEIARILAEERATKAAAKAYAEKTLEKAKPLGRSERG